MGAVGLKYWLLETSKHFLAKKKKKSKHSKALGHWRLQEQEGISCQPWMLRM